MVFLLVSKKNYKQKRKGGDQVDFIKARLKERTSLDGAALIAICGSIILFGGIVKIAAWIGLGYGIYTLVKKED